MMQGAVLRMHHDAGCAVVSGLKFEMNTWINADAVRLTE
jgi:hypothetical protein